MKVILNSDILYHPQLVTEKLANSLQQLFDACARKGHVIIIPRTALLEFDRSQSQFRENEIRKLEKTYDSLEKLKIPYTRVDPSELFKQPDLIQLIKKTGVKVEVLQPDFGDLMQAHDRACLHKCPHPPETKSDEMRDLVIWMAALRLASQDGCAILVSKDEVHVHQRGDDEATKVGLSRANGIEEALKILADLDPADKLMRQLLSSVWPGLVKAGLPVDDQMLVNLREPKFVQGDKGLSRAYCILEATTSDKKPIRATTEINIDNDIIKNVTLSDISVGNRPWQESQLSVGVDKTFNTEQDDFLERYHALKETLGG